MSRVPLMLVALLGMAALAACEQDVAEAPPKPHELTADAIGHYCGMSLLEHTGPKGQIILASRAEPIWFSSARDAVAFTKLPEEPKDIRGIYVSDMAKAPSWDHPGQNNWIDARQAFFVIGSSAKGGMGAAETVPFSQRSEAERFSAERGGRVVIFDDIPRDYVLGSDQGANESGGVSARQR
ncbi:MAG TPA: nitrous oxide reductase accessory protein NosL [Aestuariivirgaceae bacterium]|jgi:copper chaperone NosL